MDAKIKEELIRLFEHHFGEKPEKSEPLPPSGSYREYCRLSSKSHRVMGTWNQDLRENLAFLKFSEHFYNQGIAVPRIYAVNPGQTCYLQEDLGSTSLYGQLTELRTGKDFPAALIPVYRKVLEQLPRIQVMAGQGIDYSYCYPRAAFDKQSMLWDLNYFKYYYLKLARIGFDEQALEDDFNVFSDYLLKAEHNFFLFRDFQSRNIMLREGKPAFIDFQGGRRGALQYDLASLLYDAKADIPQDLRNELLEHYLDVLQHYHPVDRQRFKAFYTGYVLIRIMQALGAYGFRGYYEKKEHFLKSIPYAVENLRYLLRNNNIFVKLPEMFRVLQAVTWSEHQPDQVITETGLTVSIGSFSYKQGLPADHSAHGGGFVFDCRAIHNPGRYETYRRLSGKDKKVAEFLEKKSEMPAFLSHVFALTDQSVRTYLNRGFSYLSIQFGCTGGQHRSVYAAEKMAEHLQKKFPVKLILSHREQTLWEKGNQGSGPDKSKS
ncbi:MAG: RNase adapter RapZ [Mangrovibacterium sp.]